MAAQARPVPTFNTLIALDALAAHLSDKRWVIVDCRYKLEDESWGERQYAERHIAGAAYAHLARDLAGPPTGRNGRHPLPDVDQLSETFRRWGISRGVQVVAYDQDTGMFASRLWWLLRWLGHDGVAVLDGGFAKWTAEGYATAGGEERHTRGEFRPAPRHDLVVTADDVAARMNQPDWRIVDARSPERYRGEVEPLDNIAGRIPATLNHFFLWNLDEGGRFRAAADLRAQFQKIAGDVPPDRVVCYCGSGVSACHNVLALEHAGLRGVKLYPGSWSEWSSDPLRPVARGQ
jgi:thiosulfate/3-mercaptopyruvate sulfurtransferase